MHIKIVKTYACKKAIPNSKLIIINNGIDIININHHFINVKFKTKVLIIWTKVCPANILAANLIAKLNILIKYEKISIGISIIRSIKGLCGMKIFKNSK